MSVGRGVGKLIAYADRSIESANNLVDHGVILSNSRDYSAPRGEDWDFRVYIKIRNPQIKLPLNSHYPVWTVWTGLCG